LAVSTLGKVIKRGWDWVGLSPAHLERVGGLIEIPALAASLTLTKGDFLRTGPRGAAFLAYRKAVQEAVSAQLAAWGEARDAREARRPRTGRIERTLQTVLADLAEEFPLLTALVDWRRGGQRRLLLAGRGAGAVAPGRVVVSAAAGAEHEVAPSPPSIALPSRTWRGHRQRRRRRCHRQRPAPGGRSMPDSRSGSATGPTTRSSAASRTRRCG
jgi:hypothetical protein